MGWFSKIEQPLVRDASIALWRLFSDLDLSEAQEEQVQEHARLLHARAEGRRAADRSRSRHRRRAPATPSSAHTGGSPAPSCFRSRASPTRLSDLLGAPQLVERHRDGLYVTLRLTSSMYHRFHAPHDCTRRARHLHLGRHLERESDRAAADREAVLQERARRDRNPARATAICSRSCRSPPSWSPASGCIA